MRHLENNNDDNNKIEIKNGLDRDQGRRNAMENIMETNVYMYARVEHGTFERLLERITEMTQKDSRITKIIEADIHIVTGEKKFHDGTTKAIEFYEAVINVEYADKFHGAQNVPVTPEELDTWADNAST